MAKKLSNEKLADKIARFLFTSGGSRGEKADRLVLMQEPYGKPKRDLGGWGISAAANAILGILEEYRVER